MTRPDTHWPRADRAPAWGQLAEHLAEHGAHFDLRPAFAGDPQRFKRLSFEAPHVFADLSKQWLDAPTLALLLQLARETGVEAQRDAMLAGVPINATEGREVLHTALRSPAGQAPHGDEVAVVLEAMLAFADRIRDTAASGIRDVVHIGIGGSDLGPRMVVQALAAYGAPDIALHFVANVDGHDLAPLLPRLDPQRTLFIIASKTFTTQETMANAQAAKLWFEARGGRDIARHFVGLTTNIPAARAFGITTTFGFWDWVGGRYSLWSAIGLPIAIAIGTTGFRALLAGAHAMDRHFREAPLERNVPVLLGLLDVWLRNFRKLPTRSVAPYHQGLARLPAFLQQLEMESNGKRVDREGEALPYATSAVVWGEPGTNGQHAYFQMLHQGTDVVPVDFIAVRRTSHELWSLDPAMREQLEAQHTMLLANCLAQSQALMFGKRADEARGEKVPTAAPGFDADRLAQHRSFPGNRPSTTLVLERLDPQSLGALIALHEHRVFAAGAVWGINSFDQWGVELGKSLCNALLPRFASGDAVGLDGSTAGLLKRLRG
jgi:glucose-6-phosphate isomerase